MCAQPNCTSTMMMPDLMTFPISDYMPHNDCKPSIRIEKISKTLLHCNEILAPDGSNLIHSDLG